MLTKKNVLFKTYFEAIFFALMVATSESYALFYFTKQGLGHFQVALMSTIPLLMGASFQFIVPKILKDRYVAYGILASIFTQIIGLGLLVYCAYRPIEEFSFPLLLAGLSCYWVGGQTCAPLWLDWVSRLTESKEEFGKYLARRNTISTLLIMVFYFSFSLLIDAHFYIPFFAVFSVGLSARVGSFIYQSYLTCKSMPLIKDTFADEFVREEVDDSDNEFLKPLFAFFIWTALFRFSVNLSAPFFLPYMVGELEFTTIQYVCLTSIPFLGRALFVHNWGRASTGIRSFWGIQLACVFISVIPLLWTFHQNIFYLAGLEFFSGVFWGGFELTVVLMVQNFAGKNVRKYLGIHMALMTLFSVLGAMCAAMLLRFGLEYTELFRLSTGVRLLVSFGLIYTAAKFSMTKLSKQETLPYLTSVLSLRPSMANIGRIVLPSRRRPTDN
jgi:hypothetical protein